MADHLGPQPPPKWTATGGDVWLDVLDVAEARPCRWFASYRLLGDMYHRRAQGLARYGTPLQYDNGRDHWTDAYQEALDLVAYLHAARAPWWMRWASILFAALVRRRLPETA